MSNSTLTTEQVCEYLREHPDFFEKHEDLLADIHLPHASGNAVSLVERQVSVLRERNMDMRHRLSKLLDNARDNDKLFDKTRRLCLSLMEANSLSALVDSLYYSFDRDFSIEFTSLILFSPTNSRAREASLNQAREHANGLIKAGRATCGALQPDEYTFLFDENAELVQSAAVVPLIHGNCFGLLAVGNSDPQYYRSSMGSLFLSFIGEMLNRQIPRYLK